MRLVKFGYLDLLIFSMFALLICYLIMNWDQYSRCSTPINSWLLGTYVMIPFLRLMDSIIRTTESFTLFKTSIFISVLLGLPGIITWTVLGSLWFTILNQETPNCIPNSQLPFLIVWWIGLCSFIGIVFIISIIIEIIKFRRNRRLLVGFRNVLETGDLFYQHFTAQGLLTTDRGLCRGVGLKKKEIKLLDKYVFVYTEKASDKTTTETIGSSMVVGDKEICCICLNKYMDDENLCVLPSCKHVFHQQCLKLWMARCPVCPYCKSDVRNKLLHMESV